MRLDRYVGKERIINIKSDSFKGALEELLDCCVLPKEEKRSKKNLLKELISQESTVSSYLGQGVSLPHVRIHMRKPYLFALGRISTPLKDESVNASEEIRLIVLLLASKKAGAYLNMLAALAKTLQTSNLAQEITHLSLEEFQERAHTAFKGMVLKPAKTGNRFNRIILREAIKIAKAGNCSTLFLFVDAFTGAAGFIKSLKQDFKIVFITHKATEILQKDNTFTLPVQLFSQGRLTQLRSAILLALMHKIIRHNEKICCIGGRPNSNRLDTLLIIEVSREIQSVFSNQTDILPKNVQPEVFERLLTIATELAVEGREGNAVGCLFVLGNSKELAPFVRPLVLNPFYGYKAEDRNLLNPFIDETIKEFSLLDGAFVIGGDGVLESAGSLIYTPEQYIPLPSGLGTRHAAAMAISNAADCIALTVSASTGQVTMFRKGKMLPLIEKGIGHSNIHSNNE